MRSIAVRYGTAVLLIAAALLLRSVLDPDQKRQGFFLVFAAVILASSLGGLGPAIFSLITSLAASWAIALASGQTQTQPPQSPAVFISGLVFFVFVAVFTAVISDAKRAAQQRAESEAQEAVRQGEQLRTTLSCIGDAVIVTDIVGRLTMMNPIAEALTGWKMAEAENKPLDEVFRISNEHTRQAAENPVHRVLREGVIVGLANHTILTAKDGIERPIDDSAAPIRDKSGKISGVVLIFRDVAERRRAEQALLDADRRKDEFLAILAHELRNPLAPICMGLSILRTPSVDATTMEWAKDVMERQVHVMVRLVDDLLDVSRIMRGKIEMRKEAVDLRSVVSRAVETAQPVIDAKQHELVLTLPDTPLMIVADAVRLAQVVSNLLTNAAKYTEPCGRIWLSGGREENHVVIRVRDSGIGIPKNMLPLVFDLFTQVDSSTSRSQGGLGIGLTLVKSLVEMMGGNVVAYSEGVGHGSELVVQLPTAQETEKIPVADQSSGAAHAPPSASKHRILVVDDNADAAETLTTMLRLEGHEVFSVHDGPTALEEARVRQPEIVFLDLGMPGMDGFEVAQRLRQYPGTASAVLVAVTGWGQDDDRRRTRDAGFDHHLVKPVESAAISQLLAVNDVGRPID